MIPRQPTRVIAKASHENPETGKPCKGAVSAVANSVMGSRGFLDATIDGVEIPRWSGKPAEKWGLLSSGKKSLEGYEGWLWHRARRAFAWAGDCPACGQRKILLGHLVEGKLDRDKKCDGRCRAARGPVCVCSCGGMNHGAGHGDMS